MSIPRAERGDDLAAWTARHERLVFGRVLSASASLKCPCVGVAARVQPTPVEVPAPVDAPLSWHAHDPLSVVESLLNLAAISIWVNILP